MKKIYLLRDEDSNNKIMVETDEEDIESVIDKIEDSTGVRYSEVLDERDVEEDIEIDEEELEEDIEDNDMVIFHF